MSLIDWQTVTEPPGHYKTISAQQDGNIMSAHECVSACARRRFFLQACVRMDVLVSVGGQALHRLPIAP